MLLHITLSPSGQAFSVVRHLRQLTNASREETQVKSVSKADTVVKILISDGKKKTSLEYGDVSLCLSHSNAQLIYFPREISESKMTQPRRV